MHVHDDMYDQSAYISNPFELHYTKLSRCLNVQLQYEAIACRKSSRNYLLMHFNDIILLIYMQHTYAQNIEKHDTYIHEKEHAF